ncbi:FecR family protein [Rhizobium daejeonense]|uniref:FecR family protein n=1 Tax=Rhizobium daejeonense TaxID=240521 RepID=A0A6M1S4U2_9HYPH|nr:FecR family protein [Rhizobium daejeonense]NGO65943.1 FecR family protein [Rhizobium daejeonense]
MTDQKQTSADTTRIEREAIAWFTRMNGKPSHQDRRDFEDWLDAAPEHRTAFEGVEGLWSDLGASMQVGGRVEDSLALPLEKISRLRERRAGLKASAVIVSCLALLIAGTWTLLERPHLLQDMRADVVSPRGDRKALTLSDGSHVLLDADSALDVRVSGSERRVRLLRGTAFFQITHTGTPFVVEAAGGEVRVLGTEFDVSLKEDRQVTVTLAKGSIQVAMIGSSKDVVLKPGESVDYGTGGLSLVKQAVIEDEMAWHNGRFIFNNARLADVLAQIGRYRAGRIVILGLRLGELRVSGNIELDETDKALAAVQSTVGFRLNSFGRLTIIGP